MKNLATCKPSEFVAQTAKIKDAVANWVEVIELLSIRATKPKYLAIPENATLAEIEDIKNQNAALKKEQAMKNLNVLFDNMLVKHPKETLDVLALCCFVEPKDVDKHTMDEYLQCIIDMMQNKSVMSFFSLLAQLEMPQRSI